MSTKSDPILIWIAGLIQIYAGYLPKCCGLNYLVGLKHLPSFVKIRQWLWEMLINLLQSPIRQWWGKLKIDPEAVFGVGVPPKVNPFFQLVGPIITHIGTM